VYCRDTGGTVSGVIYRARIRYWPCVAEEVIRLHSGNGPIGGPDGEVLGTPLLAGTVGPAEFAQAAMGLPATVVDLGASEPCGGLAADPAARWVWQNNHYGTLFAQPFQIRSCNLVGARVRFTHSQSASMGFGIVAGVYVNGHALQLEPVAPPLGDCDRAFEAVVPAAFLNASATNWLFVHVPSTPALPIFFPLTIYSATIRVRTPPISASLTIDSGPGVRMLTGNAYGPLRSAPFTAADFAACTANASVVAAPSGWATSLTPAQWVATDASRTPRSTLFAQDFQVPFCTASLTRVRLRFTCAVDDALGDPSGNGANPRGVYLNGTAVEASWTALGGGSVVAFERDVTGLLRDGLNTLYVYDRDLAGVKSGAVWSARIDVDPCAGSTIGAGCPGTPATIGIAVPVLGGVGSISLAHLPPSAPLALLAIGTSIPALDLGVLGAAGCLAHVAPFVMPLGVPAGGQFVYSFAVPFDPTLVGYELAAQGVYGDPAFNSSGIVSTPAAVLVVQP
ncbi:MAG TPA: hypothetical protein VFZ65_05115, partial [Planctomycetota bacterium]|nr:hypothetical protein [Planctomycetota bacterium]